MNATGARVHMRYNVRGDARRKRLWHGRNIGFQLWPFSLPAMLAACGGGGESPGDVIAPVVGLPTGYTPPASTYTVPASTDSYSFVLQTAFVDPYWVASLRNSNFGQLDAFVQGYDRTYSFVFPTIMPDYYAGTSDATGWAPASTAMQVAYRDIFQRLEAVLNVSFVEGTNLSDYNVIAISTNVQTGTSGYAYYPSSSYLLGSDVLISAAYVNPIQASNGSTNFDYEVLVHELGHALGLKHPFEADGSSTTILNATEDTTVWTTMSYDTVRSSFDGEFRVFDLMAFSEAYGVNASYRSGDDSYVFSGLRGVFVIDGGGTDTISAVGQTQGVVIDLREGAQSYVGESGQLISSAYQLAIAPNTKIENAFGGSGNDFLTGNALDNRLDGGSGDDRIFAGEGSDVVIGGRGADRIDLSEVTQVTDTVVFDVTDPAVGADSVYSFRQGSGGDVIQFQGGQFEGLLDVVSVSNVPEAFVQGYILRLVDAVLGTAEQVVQAFSDGGVFTNLNLTTGSNAIVIAADSQATGEDQSLFYIAQGAVELTAVHLATLSGNYLDLDSWQATNFA